MPTYRTHPGTHPAALPLLAASLLLAGCAGSGARRAGGLADYRDLDLQAYAGAHPQDTVKVPARAEAMLLIAPLVSNQPPGERRAFAHIAVQVAGPDSVFPAGGAGPFLKEAVLTVKAAPGFTLIALHGHEGRRDSIADGVDAYLGPQPHGVWRHYVAELEGRHEPGRERLVGATLRTFRRADGSQHETLGGVSVDWHKPGIPADMPALPTRQVAVVINGLALREASRLAGQGAADKAAALLDLQVNTTRALAGKGIPELEPELGRLEEARRALSATGESDSVAASVAAAWTALAVRGPSLASRAPSGPWTSLAGILAGLASSSPTMAP